MDYELTQEERDRLTLLADYLETLPEDYTDFNMASFFDPKSDDEDGELQRKYALENGGVGICGTSACAVGHGPSAGIMVPESLIAHHPAMDGNGSWSVDWDAYTELFTGTGLYSYRLFAWMFGGMWHDVDNHHYGAAARIRYVLMGEDVPIYAPSTKGNVALYEKYRKTFGL
jgi:hypothetical protein